MIYVPKVAGFGTDDLKHQNKKRLFKRTAKQVSSLDQMFERRVFRDQLKEKASDKKGITLNEMADIATEERFDKKDRIDKKEARQVAKYFGISKRRLMKARNRYYAGLHEDASKKGIAKPYGQRDDDDRPIGGRGFGTDDGPGHTPSSPPPSVRRGPMF